MNQRSVKYIITEFFRPSEVEMYSPSVEDKDGFLEPGPEIFGCYDKNGENEGYKFPYGVVGRRLWVRETFAENVAGCPGGISYRADHQDPQGDGPSSPLRWKPSIHMPRWASRITLEITKVRVERLQDINEEDARAEGSYLERCPCLPRSKDRTPMDAMFRQTGCYIHGTEFHELWDSLHGKGAWEKNPWVWVIEFKRHRSENITRSDSGSEFPKSVSGRSQ